MLEIRDLALDAPDGQPLLAGLDLAVPTGGNLVVTGPSGSGKTWLLKVIAGLECPAGGRVRVAGRDIWPGDGALGMAGRVSVGFAFATGGLLSNLSLAENVALPLRFLGMPAAESQPRVKSALLRLGLAAVASLRPHAVSAAARKHANLARVLALQPALVLLDDPLEGLDTADRAVVRELLQAWAADGAYTLVIAAEEAASFAYLEAERLQLSSMPMPVESP